VTADSATLVRTILDFWFGARGSPESGTLRPIWFEVNETFDEEIRKRFEKDVLDAGRGALDGLSSTAEGVLTLVILLDQFPRNMFRGSPRAFAFDPKARAVARLATGMGLDKLLSPVERMFLYLPFEHSEDLDDQIRSVALFKTLPAVPWRDEVVDYAVRHHDMIVRFGRFPYRNAVLGRTSTAAELAFLEGP
jgi:uncharacterized protein (DUF924 family)